jgi:hypothetical protein
VIVALVVWLAGAGISYFLARRSPGASFLSSLFDWQVIVVVLVMLILVAAA